MTTLEVKNPNSLNIARFLCSVFVLLSHLDWIAGNNRDNFRICGVYSVAIFFGISGFLLASNLEQYGPTWNFLRNRFLRVFPGFLVCLFLTAFVFAPIYSLYFCKGECGIPFSSMFGYFFRNISTSIFQPDILGTLQQSEVKTWNPSLWTLRYELACYFILFIAVKLFRNKLFIFSLLAVTASIFSLYFLTSLEFYPSQLFLSFSRFLLYFFTGVAFFFIRSLFVFKLYRVGLLTFCFLIGFKYLNQDGFYGLRTDFLSVTLIATTLFLAYAVPPLFFQNNDFSYGMYIYSGPVTHMVVLIFPDVTINWTSFAFIVFVFSLSLSMLSWFLVEKTALKFKRNNVFQK